MAVLVIPLVLQSDEQANSEDALKRVLLDSVQVKLNRDTESRLVTQVRSVLEAPAHLLSYLLEYFCKFNRMT